MGTHTHPRIRCPHCRSHAIAADSKEITITYREVYFQCRNAECGHTYVASLSVLRTVHPSRTPNPAVALPFSPAARRWTAPAQIPAAANDEGPPAAAEG